MKYIDKKKIYQGTLITGLLFLAISFIFRYKYINFLGFDRPLKLACTLLIFLGAFGSITAIIDGVNKNFRDKILLLAILNLIMAFSYPILLVTEKSIGPVENPYKTSAPNKGYSTKFRKDTAFIIEGELYKFPISLSDFTKNGFDYSLKEKDKKLVATISRSGESFDPKPTWFTDGINNEVYREFYLLEAYYDLGTDEKNIDNIPIKELSASLINNNRDFEICGIKLEDSIYDVKNTFGEKLTEDNNNKTSPIKVYYLKTDDDYTIRLNSLNGNIQSIDLY